MGFGVHGLGFGVWGLGAGVWRLRVGDWKLGVWGWALGFGGLGALGLRYRVWGFVLRAYELRFVVYHYESPVLHGFIGVTVETSRCRDTSWPSERGKRESETG